MKTYKNVTIKKYKLLKFKIIKTKVYKIYKKLSFIEHEKVKNRIKKIFNIIYKFHINNKKIIFIGNSLLINVKIKKLLKNTKHIIINKNNYNSSLKYNLVVLIDDELSNLKLLSKNYENRIPIVVSLSSKLTTTNLSTYKTLENFNFKEKEIFNNFFYSMLKTTLKKLFKTKKLNKKNYYYKYVPKKKNKQIQTFL